ncbi:MAG: PaaI family thioesterase [Halieaceae bacterium]
MHKAVPADFEELPEGLGFTDILRPLYRRNEGVPAVGMFVQARHTNLLDICHGGVLMTLADIGASWAINATRGEVRAAPTLNLSFDFIAAAREGDWLQAQSDRVTLKKRVGFSSGVISSGERLICRYSGSFYLPDHAGFETNPDRLAVLQGVPPGSDKA